MRIMRLSLFLAIKAIISVLFGAAFALMPNVVASLYGLSLDAAATLMARLAGACLAGIGFLASLLALLSGVGNSLSWVNVVIWLLLSFGLGYYRFTKPSLQD
jgi:hypothetical protein